MTDVKPADDFGLLSAQTYIAAWSNKHDLTGTFAGAASIR